MKNSSNREIAQNRDRQWIPKMVASKYAYSLKPSRLRDARLELGKSQEEMAKMIELSHTTYGDIERGKRVTRKETAERIAGAVSRKLLDLFEKDGKKFRTRKAA
jgi:DNA-binding XRE family transcriptional regulator